MEQNMRNILISGTSEEEQLMKDSSAALSLKPLAAESSGITRDQQAEAVVKNVGNPKSADVEEDVPMTFPQRLMEILATEEHADVVGWLPHGRGFIIYKKKKFAVEVLPVHFKHSKFTSFTRKLNRWGFSRVTRGPETGAYYHKFFQRNDLRLCMQMSCQATTTKFQELQQQRPVMCGGNFNSMASAQQQQQNALLFAAHDGSGDIAQQNQSLIRHQLQQLQMRQLQLQQLQMQQLQMQQKQQLQAAELMRHAISKQSLGGDHNMDNSGLMGPGPVQSNSMHGNNTAMFEPTRSIAGNGRAWAA